MDFWRIVKAYIRQWVKGIEIVEIVPGAGAPTSWSPVKKRRPSDYPISGKPGEQY